ncbi:MAG: ATP-binding cassette domain-containing protein [Tannerella sp.]|jgi:zinc transport system ATP-binding protein|nr:ATP-binding cassette domain-containing protein [Tannerella sp.]
MNNELKRIELEHITASYEGKTVLHDISLTLWENDFLGITGPNGGGKTTLLKVVLGLLKPSGGRVRYYRNGQPAQALKIGYLPQTNRIDKRFPISVREVIASGMMVESKRLHRFSDEQSRRIDEVVGLMGIEKLAKRAVGELSGGELQRVLLGRAIVSRPEVLILDEPDTFVDKSFGEHMHQLLHEINRDTAVMLVTHDMATLLPLMKNVAHVHKELLYHPGNNYEL